MDSLLDTLNYGVDHCNTLKEVENKPVLHALIVDYCYNEVAESVGSTELRAWRSRRSHGFL